MTRPIRLYGAHEIRVLCLDGVSRQRAYQITGRPDFPDPVAELKQGRVWLADNVDAWRRTHRHSSVDDDLDDQLRRRSACAYPTRP